MFELLQNFKGKVIVNDKEFDTITEAEKYFHDYNGGIRILLKPATLESSNKTNNINDDTNDIYKIRVKPFMTNYDSDFFLSKMNKEGPMPFIVMVGRKLSQTEKLVKMELHADISQEESVTTCIKCGRPLTNPISQYLHIGPECGAFEHMKLIQSGVSKEEIKERLQNQLSTIVWTGWIPKVSILSIEKVN